jgi:hypothetical protein
MYVCCYKQQALAASSEEKEGEKPVAKTTDGGPAGKRVRAVWEVNVGEHVLDIRVARWSSKTLPQVRCGVSYSTTVLPPY